jgi:hypothetical protein
MTKFQKIFKAIGIAAAAVLLPAWFYSGLLENTYVTWPREPDPEIGRTIPYPVKRITVYITKYDQQLNTKLRWVLVGSGLIFLVGIVLSGDLRRVMNGDRAPYSH